MYLFVGFSWLQILLLYAHKHFCLLSFKTFAVNGQPELCFFSPQLGDKEFWCLLPTFFAMATKVDDPPVAEHLLGKQHCCSLSWLLDENPNHPSPKCLQGLTVSMATQNLSSLEWLERGVTLLTLPSLSTCEGSEVPVHKDNFRMSKAPKHMSGVHTHRLVWVGLLLHSI